MQSYKRMEPLKLDIKQHGSPGNYHLLLMAEEIPRLTTWELREGKGSWNQFHYLEGFSTIQIASPWRFHFNWWYCWWWRNPIPNHRLDVKKTRKISGKTTGFPQLVIARSLKHQQTLKNDWIGTFMVKLLEKWKMVRLELVDVNGWKSTKSCEKSMKWLVKNNGNRRWESLYSPARILLENCCSVVFGDGIWKIGSLHKGAA